LFEFGQRDDFVSQGFESRIAAERIEHGIHSDPGSIDVVVVEIFAFEAIDCLGFVAQSDVNQRYDIAAYKFVFWPVFELSNQLQCFVFLAGIRVGTPKKAENLRVIIDRTRFLVFGDCARRVALEIKGFTQIPMRVPKSLIELERPLQLCDGLIVTARHHQRAAKIGIDDKREWIQFDCALTLADGFIKTPKGDQKRIAVPMMRRRVIRVDRNSALKFLLRLVKIHVGETEQQSQRGVCFG
jgi:hypothetical protein